jgi:hypothetical protein
MTEPVRVIYTCGWGADDRDSETAEIIGHSASGLVRILFPDAETYWTFPEELEVIE